MLGNNFWAKSWTMEPILVWLMTGVDPRFWVFVCPCSFENWPQILSGFEIWWVSWTSYFNILFTRLSLLPWWSSITSCMSKLLLRRWEKLLLEMFLGSIVSKPSALDDKQPHTWLISGWFNVSMEHVQKTSKVCLWQVKEQDQANKPDTLTTHLPLTYGPLSVLCRTLASNPWSVTSVFLSYSSSPEYIHSHQSRSNSVLVVVAVVLWRIP